MRLARVSSVCAALALVAGAALQAQGGGARPPETTPTAIEGTEAVPYRQAGEAVLQVFVAKPKGWRAEDRRAGLVFFFGGGWNTGTPERSAGWARWAAQQGLVGFAPDYRTRGRFGTTPFEAVDDARAALRFIQQNAAQFGLDPARIAVGGSSAGGHLALWTALPEPPAGRPEAAPPLHPPAAVFLYSAVSDTSPETGYGGNRFGGRGLDLSPRHHLPAGLPPLLAFHGDADPTVPHAQSVALAARWRELGGDAALVLVPGGNHNFSGQFPEWRDKSRGLVADFLRRLQLLPAR